MRLLSNVVPTRGDARQLPSADGTFDAAYLTTILGEGADAAGLTFTRRSGTPLAYCARFDVRDRREGCPT